MSAYLDCKHQHRLLVESMRATMPKERYHISVCADCGRFQVFAEKEGVFLNIHFTLNTPDLVQAAGRYLEILEAEQ